MPRCLRRREIDIAHQMFSAIISLANPIGAESIGGDDIGSCIQIAHRDFFNDLRLRQRQYVIIAFLVFCQTKCASIGSFRSEEHTSELQSLMRISYAVFCLKKKTTHNNRYTQDIR